MRGGPGAQRVPISVHIIMLTGLFPRSRHTCSRVLNIPMNQPYT